MSGFQRLSPQPLFIMQSKNDSVVKVLIDSSYSKFSNYYFDTTKNLSKSSRVLYRYLFRISYGFSKNVTHFPISFNHLIKHTGLARASVSKALKELLATGFIKARKTVFNRGVVYEVFWKNQGGQWSNHVPEKDYFKLTHEFFDIAPFLLASEQDVYFYLYRHSYGYHQNVTKNYIKTSEIANAINLSKRRVPDAINGLIKKGLIQKLDKEKTYGCLYRVFLPSQIIKSAKNELLGGSSKTSCEDKNELPGSSKMSFSSDKIELHKRQIKNNIKTSSSGDEFILIKKRLESLSPGNRQRLNFRDSKLRKWMNQFGAQRIISTLMDFESYLFDPQTGNCTGLFVDILKNPEHYQAKIFKQTNHEQTHLLAIQNCQEQGKKANEEERKKRLIDLEWQKLSMERTQSLINQYTSQLRSQYIGQRFRPPESALQSLAISKAKSEYYNQVQTIAAADNGMGFTVNGSVNQGVNATVNSTVNYG